MAFVTSFRLKHAAAPSAASGQRSRTCPRAMSKVPLLGASSELPRVAFLGAGNMAGAMVQGMLSAGTFARERVCVTTRNAEKRREWREKNVTVHEDNIAAATSAEVVVLGVKPAGIVPELRDSRRLFPDFRRGAPDQLFVSIAAGVTLEALERCWPKARFVRVMPNMPALVGRGASVYALGSNATEHDAAAVQTILQYSGSAERMDESLIDAATGVNGCGPAYVYILIEAMADAGVLHGLKRDAALRLAAQTVLGSAEMVMREGAHPAQLRNQVESPGGCTIAAVRALEAGNVRSAVFDAVDAAVARAKDLQQ